jgi:uncharacterized protein YjeT (DUF2065 family)
MYNYLLTQALIKEAAALELLKEAQLLKLAVRQRPLTPEEKLRLIGRGALVGGLVGLPVAISGIVAKEPEYAAIPIGTAILGSIVARSLFD